MTQQLILDFFKRELSTIQLPRSRDLRQLQMTNAQFQNYTRQINATWHFQKMEIFFPDLSDFLSSAGKLLQKKISPHALYTPANSPGFPPHYDFEDTVLYQVEGTKHWRKWKPFRDAINPSILAADQKNNSILEWAKVSPATEFTLNPGDFFFMPAGHPHVAWTTSHESLHYSFALL